MAAHHTNVLARACREQNNPAGPAADCHGSMPVPVGARARQGAPGTRRKLHSRWLALALAAAICLSSLAGRPAVLRRSASDPVTRLDAFLSAQALAHNFSGAVVMTQNDTVLLSKGYGMADWSRALPNTAHTPYPIGVDTMAAVAILQLEDAGSCMTEPAYAATSRSVLRRGRRSS